MENCSMNYFNFRRCAKRATQITQNYVVTKSNVKKNSLLPFQVNKLTVLIRILDVNLH